MKTMTTQLAGLFLTLLIGFGAVDARAQGTAFSYQGRLNDGSGPTTGSYDLTFGLFNVSAGAGQVGSPLTNSAVAVSNGLFVVTLDFGANFPGAARWLEIGVRTNGGGTFTTLAPRQPLTATPYAITAGNVTGTVAASQLSGTIASAQFSGTYGGAVTFSNAANSFGGNGTGLTNVNAATLGGLSVTNFWKTGGNAGTVAGTNFLGTTDLQPLEFKVNNTRVLRLESTSASGDANLIGGYRGNYASNGILGAVVAGGGSLGNTNRVTDHYAVVGGGYGNLAGDEDANFNSASYSVVAGGYNNASSGQSGVVSGGGFNTNTGFSSVISGGQRNRITNSLAVVAGGYNNLAGGSASTVAGGEQNRAMGSWSFAAGYYAWANHDGTFVWGDSLPTPLASTTTNQFLIRAQNGVGINKANPQSALDVNGAITATNFLGNGAGLTNVNAAKLGGLSAGNFWRTDGNVGTTAGVSFLGTTDNQPLEIKVNGQRAFRLELTTNSPNVIGGFSGNLVSNTFGATIAGGGFGNAPNIIFTVTPNFFQHATIGGGAGNAIFDYGSYATIAGGSSNRIGVLGTPGQGALYSAIGGGLLNSIEGTYIQGGNATAGTIGGGVGNTIHSMDGNTIGGGRQNGITAPSHVSSTIGGGESNSISWGSYVTIGGGRSNSVQSADATVGGGYGNAINGGDFLTPATAAVIGGGRGNSIGQGAVATTIAGGATNSITAFASSSAIGGGQGNWVNAAYGTIAGGLSNLATNQFAVVGGGSNNAAGGLDSTIAGGAGNAVFGVGGGLGSYSTVGGGWSNIIRDAGATIGGGQMNGADTKSSTISGGEGNRISDATSNHGHESISGGYTNTITDSGSSSIGGGEGNLILGSPVSAYNAIGGGLRNTIQQKVAGATIGGGSENTIDTSSPTLSSASTIGGGVRNSITLTGPGGTIAGGTDNIIKAVSSGTSGGAVGGGSRNVVGGDYGTIAGGNDNSIQFTNGMAGGAIGGGSWNVVAAEYGTIPGGYLAVSRSCGQMAYASGAFATNGDAQTSVFVCRNSTADATQTELFLDSTALRIKVPTNSTWTFEVMVTGRTASGNSAGYQISGVIENNAGTTTLVGALTKTVLAEDIGSWDATVVADNANDALEVKVTGAAATNIRWVATIRTVEVIY